ncbi:MAG: hypothetical protein L0196_07005 [candidate division Zixibacteria bacterium]|nr:hypothetical protein [candidate division Zixibacteria bacterium]
MEGVYYTALVKDEGKIDQMIKYFDQPRYKPAKVALSLEQSDNGVQAPDGKSFELKLKQGLLEWSKACRQVYQGRAPNYCKGIILEPDGTPKKLAFVFGKFADNEWRCHGYFPYQTGIGEPAVNYEVIGLLRQLEAFVDELDAKYSFVG